MVNLKEEDQENIKEKKNGVFIVDTISIKKEPTPTDEAHDFGKSKTTGNVVGNLKNETKTPEKMTQEKSIHEKGIQEKVPQAKTNSSGNSSDADEFVDSYSTNLITKKDIPQDVAIAIQALGDLKKSTKIINNIKKNANFVLENSKIHLNKNIQDIHTFKNITNKVVKKKFASRRKSTKKGQWSLDNGKSGKDEEGKESYDDNDEDDAANNEEDHTEEYYSGEEDTMEDTQEDTLEDTREDQRLDGLTKDCSIPKLRKKSKRRRISQAIKSHKLNLSIESKKKLFTCLHLLKLANKQLSNKVTGLQILVQHEERNMSEKKIGNKNMSEADVSGASGNALIGGTNIHSANSSSAMIPNSMYTPSSSAKNEIVGTVKKVYTLISKYTGNSLPEPARSKVRESLLKLPTKLQTYMSNDIEDDDEDDDKVDDSAKEANYLLKNDPKNDPNSLQIKQEDAEKLGLWEGPASKQRTHRVLKKVSKNKKMLLLAKESLEMVSSVMDVVDETLGKAEEWVKHKQEIKELLRKNLQQGITKNPAKMIGSSMNEVKVAALQIKTITGSAAESASTDDNNNDNITANNIHE